MLKRLLIIAALMGIMLTSLTGCSTVTGSPRELLRAPKATGDMGDIQQALYRYAGNGITLKYPRSGDNRSAFLLSDLDADGVEEAVAFYSVPDKGEPDAVHVNIIDRVRGEWRSTADVVTVGTAIDKVSVADISGKGAATLFVGVELFSATGNQLNLYSYKDNKLTQQAQENYTSFMVCDLIGDGSDQLLLFSLNSAERTSQVRMYTFNGDAIELRGSVSTDGNISSYQQIAVGALSSGQTAIFVDANKSSLSTVTDVIFYSDGKLLSPLFDPTVGETQITVRNFNELCKDINGDGVVEIPFTEILPGYASRSENDRMYLTAWKRFDGQLFGNVLRGDFFYSAGYRLEFPESWVGNVTLVTDNENRMRSYRVWDPVMQTTGRELLRVRVYNADDYERIDKTGIIELERTDATVWAARVVSEEDEYSVDAETVRKLFSRI